MDDTLWDPQSPATPPGQAPLRTRVVCPMCDRALPATTRVCNCPGSAEALMDLSLRVHTSRRWGKPVPYGFLLHLLPGGWTRWKRAEVSGDWSLPGGPCPRNTSIRDWVTFRMMEDGWPSVQACPHHWIMVDHLWGSDYT